MIPPGLRSPRGPHITGWDQLEWAFRMAVGFWAIAFAASPLLRPVIEGLAALGFPVDLK